MEAIGTCNISEEYQEIPFKTPEENLEEIPFKTPEEIEKTLNIYEDLFKARYTKEDEWYLRTCEMEER